MIHAEMYSRWKILNLLYPDDEMLLDVRREKHSHFRNALWGLIHEFLNHSLLLALLHQQLILIHSFIQHFMWASETWSESTMMWNGLKFKFTQSVMWDEIDRDIPFAHTYFQQQFSSHLILKWNVKYLMCRWSFVFECCNEPHRSRTYFHYSHRNTARSSRKKSVEIVFNLYDDDNVLDSKNCKNDIVTELISHRKRVKNDVWMSAGSIYIHKHTFECDMAKYFLFFWNRKCLCHFVIACSFATVS